MSRGRLTAGIQSMAGLGGGGTSQTPTSLRILMQKQSLILDLGPQNVLAAEQPSGARSQISLAQDQGYGRGRSGRRRSD